MNQGMEKSSATPESFGITPEYFDVIIIGTGIAGMFTALSIERKLKVLMITKETLDRSTSNMAQGGIVSPIFGETLYQDTLKAGGYVNDPKRVEILVKEGSKQIEKLIEWGVPFDRDSEGNLLATREGGHSGRNILHCKDETGKKIMTGLERKLRNKKGVTLLEETYAYQLTDFSDWQNSSNNQGDENQGAGESKEDPGNREKGGMVSVILPTGDVGKFYSPNIVIATGGIGGLYQHTSNPEGNTGDGIALGKSLGIEIKNMEFNQFHPTYFQAKEGTGFLVTEALRGEGATLRNGEGVAFMKERHPMGDLAPRDVVARGIFEELQKVPKTMVTVDISHREENFIKQRFPKIYRKALKRGYDITKEPLPVTPASHYIMGGIAVDDYAETSIPGIFAVGECACSDIHGANRLASNSLLDAIVFAGRAANKITEAFPETIQEESVQRITLNCNSFLENKSYREFSWSHEELRAFRKALKKETQKVLGIIKKDRLLSEFLLDQELALRLFDDKDPPKKWTGKEKRDFHEVKNHLTVARVMTKAALEREENIGAHYKVQDEKNP